MNRTTLLIIFAVGLLAIAGFIGILTGALRQPGETNDNVNAVTNQPVTNTVVENPTTVETEVEPGVDESPVSTAPLSAEQQAERDELKRTALTFAQTYGTYSNQNDNQHLKVLLDQTTAPLRTAFEQQIAETENAPLGQYRGFTTTAVSAEVRAVTNVTATVVVSTKRVESADELEQDRSFNQSLTLIFKKQDNRWLVAEADWQAES